MNLLKIKKTNNVIKVNKEILYLLILCFYNSIEKDIIKK